MQGQITNLIIPPTHQPLTNQLLRLVFGRAFTQAKSKWAFLDQACVTGTSFKLLVSCYRERDGNVRKGEGASPPFLMRARPRNLLSP